MAEILHGLGDAHRERIATLREGGDFFWLDVSLSETNLDDLSEALDIPERAAHVLATYGEIGAPPRKFHTDGQRLVFTTSCYIERSAGPGT